MIDNGGINVMLFTVYVLAVAGAYNLLSRIFTRVIDPSGEYRLGHGIPLPLVVRWIILAMAFVAPAALFLLLAAVGGFARP